MLAEPLIADAMRRALTLARRGPECDENPQVGCVILDPSGAIVAEGWHLGVGTPHAEVAALGRLPEAWLDRAAELTAVVTLEPCNHTGHTGPCAIALATAGIGSVAYALDDPGAESGGGANTLVAAGTQVRGGVLTDEARELLAPWIARQASADAKPAPTHAADPERPHVTVKWAQTLDGRAAAADGSSQWITGPAARADVHRKRAAADAILVGTGTLLADDPSLTARASDGTLLVPAPQQPVPVVLGKREIPAEAKVNHHPALQDPGGITSPVTLSGDDLAADLAYLAGIGVRRLFVEGGPTVVSALLAEGLVDEVLVYVAPALLGGPRLAVSDLGITNMAGIRRLDVASVTHLGDDMLITAAFAHDDTGEHSPGRPEEG